jgi:hypothetical protein
LDQTPQLGICFWSAFVFGTGSNAPEQPEASRMPGDNGISFDDDQNVAPCGPEPTEQNPKYSILDSQARTRMFSLEYAQLLMQGKDLDA